MATISALFRFIMSCGDVVFYALGLSSQENLRACGLTLRCANAPANRLTYSDHVPRKLNNFRGIAQLLLFVNFYHYFFSFFAVAVLFLLQPPLYFRCASSVLRSFFSHPISSYISPEDNYSFEIENLNLITHTHAAVCTLQKKTKTTKKKWKLFSIRALRHVNEIVLLCISYVRIYEL